MSKCYNCQAMIPKDAFVCKECAEYPHGTCRHCGGALGLSYENSDADGNRGVFVKYCLLCGDEES